MQAAGLAAVAQAARGVRELSVVCFSGFTLSRLLSKPPSAGVRALLAQVDVLIDGQYVEARNNGLGLRGSTNQRVHHLTGRLLGSGYDFENQARPAEIRVGERDVTLVGVPAPGLLDRLDHVLGST